MVDGAVRVRLFAAARDAAGTGEVVLGAGTVAQVMRELAEGRPQRLQAVLSVCSVMVGGTRVAPDDDHTMIPAGSEVDVLPPFAGG